MRPEILPIPAEILGWFRSYRVNECYGLVTKVTYAIETTEVPE